MLDKICGYDQLEGARSLEVSTEFESKFSNIWLRLFAPARELFIAFQRRPAKLRRLAVFFADPSDGRSQANACSVREIASNFE